MQLLTPRLEDPLPSPLPFRFARAREHYSAIQLLTPRLVMIAEITAAIVWRINLHVSLFFISICDPPMWDFSNG